MATVYVAAGGGGDALAAALLNRALGGPTSTILTFAWDRLVVDPLPGPRAAGDFDGLRPLGDANHVITPDTVPRPPSGSTLPRLAGSLRDTLVLLEPAGVVGMRRQLAQLVRAVGADSVTVVDVGGDVVARGHEPGLRSPLADALVLAACRGQEVPVTVLVAGPGLDGELSEAEVVEAIARRPVFRLRADDIGPFRPVLGWHPSEATALLAAAALGWRGTVEVRDAGLVVPLTDTGATVHALPLGDALALNQLAAALGTTTSLGEAEDVARKVCGFSEIDVERRKAASLSPDRPAVITGEVDAAIRTLEAEAAARGTAFLTFRRIAEATDLAPSAAAALRRHLTTTRPAHDAWPLWSVVPLDEE